MAPAARCGRFQRAELNRPGQWLQPPQLRINGSAVSEADASKFVTGLSHKAGKTSGGCVARPVQGRERCLDLGSAASLPPSVEPGGHGETETVVPGNGGGRRV